jgi:hypothetical protein
VAALQRADRALERLGARRAVADVLVVPALAIGGGEVERRDRRLSGLGAAGARLDAERLRM